MQFLAASLALALLAPLAAAGPNLVIRKDFPDPSLMKDPKSGKWFSFATAGNGKTIQMASADAIQGPWTWLDHDPFGKAGAWADNLNIWAPDVQYMPATGKYVMYYSAPYEKDKRFHCVGTATSSSINGPFDGAEVPLACNITAGGAIDPSGFHDEASNTDWVVYKIDGNSIGHGGSCNNMIEPIVATPLMLQQVKSDGYTPIGKPIQLLDRSVFDGPLIEAPNLVKMADGTYVVFFSSNCWDTTFYDISYATSKSIKGPYTKSPKPLLVTGNFNLTSPGGATAAPGGGSMVFHGHCDIKEGSSRCMYQADFSFRDLTVNIA
jgi:beta-xylosidase